MLKVSRDEKASPAKIILEGVINETTDFTQSLGTLKGSCELHCGEITRINSVGIKAWIDYFKKLRQDGVQLKFHEISPALVSTLNYVADFIDKTEMVSICAPYVCSSCETASTKTLTLAEAQAQNGAPPNIPCPKCGQNAAFDEIPDDYFAFLAF